MYEAMSPPTGARTDRRRAVAAAVAAVVLLAAGLAAAVEIPMRDGSTVTAAGYEITASYVLIRFDDGRQVAYDPADVDVAALRAAEAAAASADLAPPPAAGPKSLRDLAAGRGLELEPAESAAPTISDHDVAHVDARGERVTPEEERQEEERTGTPEGYREGGRVQLGGWEVVPLGEGRWQVEGEVVNRNQDPALDVKVRITVPQPGSEARISTVPVASVLGPDETGSFSQAFTLPESGDQTRPEGLEISVFWMQEKGSVREDQRRPVPNAPPPPPGQQRQRVEIHE